MELVRFSIYVISIERDYGLKLAAWISQCRVKSYFLSSRDIERSQIGDRK
jgi:hypothetical protein